MNKKKTFSCIQQMVIDNKTGLLFNIKDVNDLSQKVSLLMNNPILCEQYGNNGYNKLYEEYGAEMHYQKLLNVFNIVLEKSKEKTEIKIKEVN